MNLNYPTYWRASGYGLLAANPFGVKNFTEGEETFDFSISSGQQLKG